MKDKVSVIMLSRNKGRFLEASVRSVMAQTYQNWELLFVDDASRDETISVLQRLKEEDRKSFKADGILADRINITKTICYKGETYNRNAALKEAKGKWIAFLDAGDIWEPTKLEKQVAFMEEHGYSFTYTKFMAVNAERRDVGLLMSGPEKISYKDMRKCCWMGYLTVMYDQEKIGLIHVNGMKDANDYALWLQVAAKTNCYLLPECLGSQIIGKGLWHRFLTNDWWIWRYAAYRKIVKMDSISAAYMTIRNMIYAAWKWWKLSERR